MPDTKSWTEFSREHNLHFRAACNEGAETSARPLPAAVLDELRGSPEADSLYREIARNATPPAQSFFASLVKEPRWRVLIVECVERTRRAEENKKWWWERLNDWTKTATPSRPSPRDQITRVALSAFAGTLAVTVGFRVADGTQLTPPVSFRLAEGQAPLTVAVAPTVGAAAIPVQFDFRIGGGGEPPTVIPIKLTSEPAELPLRLAPTDLQALTELNATIGGAAAALRTSATQTGQLVTQASEIKEAIDRGSKPDPVIGEAVGQMRDSLRRIQGSVESGSMAAGDLKTLAAHVERSARATTRLTSLTAHGKTITTLTVVEHRPTRVRAEWLGKSGDLASCDVIVSAGAIGRTVSITSVAGTCNDQPIPRSPTLPLSLHAGDLVRLGTEPVAVIVDSISTPFFGPNHAALRIVSLPIAELEERSAIAKPAAPQ